MTNEIVKHNINSEHFLSFFESVFTFISKNNAAVINTRGRKEGSLLIHSLHQKY